MAERLASVLCAACREHARTHACACDAVRGPLSTPFVLPPTAEKNTERTPSRKDSLSKMGGGNGGVMPSRPLMKGDLVSAKYPASGNWYVPPPPVPCCRISAFALGPWLSVGQGRVYTGCPAPHALDANAPSSFLVTTQPGRRLGRRVVYGVCRPACATPATWLRS